jgi:hypothetical protein
MYQFTLTGQNAPDKTPRNSRITPEMWVLRTRFMSQFCKKEFGNGGS